VYVISSNSSNIPPQVNIAAPADGSRNFANEPVFFSAFASDLNGTVSEVKLYEGPRLVGSDASYPYEYNWFGSAGTYTFTAMAIDNQGASRNSKAITLNIDPTPSCRGSAFNGDFDYQFSEDESNPTLTFIPSKAGVGSPTCILYYGLNAGSLPGYNVSPNVPFRITAAKGAQVYFYYTYSYPGAGERNTGANKNTYKVGSCKPFAIGLGSSNNLQQLHYYPNPVEQTLNIELPIGSTQIKVFDLSGKLMDIIETKETLLRFDMRDFGSGIYLFEISNGSAVKQIKVIK
jgi:hypothetical protein